MNNCMSLDKRLELWERSLSKEDLFLLTYAIKSEVDKINDNLNNSIDSCYGAAIGDYTNFSIKEIRQVIKKAYDYMNELNSYLRKDEDIMKKVEKVEEELKEFLRKEMEAGNLKSKAIVKAKKKFNIPAKDISNEWLIVKEEDYPEKCVNKHAPNKDSNKSQNKDNTEDGKQSNKITPKIEKEAKEEPTEVQKEEIKTKLVEITEIRKFRGQFGEYEKTKEGVKLKDLIVSTKADVDELEKQVDLKYETELQDFIKEQEKRKNISLGRLKEIEELLNI